MIGLALWLGVMAQAGIPAVDTTVTATKPLSASRAAAPSGDTCDEPVLLVASGPVQDPARMEAYAKAIAVSGLYQQLGGYHLNTPRPLDVLEGNPQSIAVVLRFPCRANALAFWNSTTYQGQLTALRSNPPAADLAIAIYPEAPLRPDMVGKVGDARYSASFDAAAVPQSPAAKP